MNQFLRAVGALLGLLLLFIAAVLVVVMVGTQSTMQLAACLVLAGSGTVLVMPVFVGHARTARDQLVGLLDWVGQCMLGLAPLAAVAWAFGGDHAVEGAVLVLVMLGGLGALARLPTWLRSARSARSARRPAK